MKCSVRTVFIFTLIVLSSSLSFGEDDSAVVSDFDSGQARNNRGGEIEVWLAGDGTDATQTCRMSFVQDDALGNESGHSLRIDYDVDSPNPAYNGVRMNLDHFDAARYQTLNFYIKGDRALGFTKVLKIELIGQDAKPSPYMVSGITEEWQKITVPLTEFFLIRDWSALEKLVVVFADISNDPKVGTLYLDHVYFSKQ